MEVDLGINKSLSANNLSTYVAIDQTADHFTFNISYNGSLVYQLNSMVFDAYLVTLNATVNTIGGDYFNGIWGLGERISSFFYQDGVYTTNARD
jgi:hypothetical protein